MFTTHLSLAIPGIVTGEADGLVAVVALVVIVAVLVVAKVHTLATRHQRGENHLTENQPR